MFIVADRAGRRPVIRGRVDMGSAHISGQFLIRDAAIEERAPIPAGSAYSRSAMNGTALNAPRLSVGADVTLEGSCLMTGGIDLSLSEMSRLSIQDTTALRAAGRTALDLTNAELRSALTLGSDVTVEGALHLEGATVHGNLTLQGVTLTAPERGALVTATGLRVDGDVELQKLHATGGRLRFGSTTTLGSIIAAGAQLTNAGGEALSLHQATIKGSVIMAAGFRSAGQVVLSRAAIGGRLQCARGQFTGPGPFAAYEQGHAIKAISATIGGGIDLRGTTIEPSLDFTDVTTTVLADDQHSWPPTFMISGLTYERFAQDSGQAWDWAARCAWLSRQHGYDAGPYEQAARVFRQHGYPAGAEEILMAQRRQARRSITGRGALLRRARDAAYGLTVGYGYRPGRVLWLLAALLILVTVSLQIPAGQATMRAAANGRVYISGNPQAATNSGHGSGATCASGEIRCFSAPLYAIDTVIPLISLDQRSTWYPDRQAPGGSFMQWWLDTATLLGWLLSSIFVLSLARLARTR